MRNKVLKIHPADDLIVALSDLHEGDRVTCDGETFALSQRIQAKHKFSRRDIQRGELLTMYGVTVGRATDAIGRGQAVTTENLIHATAEFSVGASETNWIAPECSKFQGRTFLGYHRSDGSVGTTNNWIVVPLVFCESRNLQVMREAMLRELGYDQATPHQRLTRALVELHRKGASADELLEIASEDSEQSKPRQVFPNIDGVKFLDHVSGCGDTKHDVRSFLRLVAGYICHPNVAGATILSLGCQYAQVALLQETIKEFCPSFDKPLFIFEQQQIGSEYDLIQAAIKQTFIGLTEADKCSREPAPLSNLCIGMECGGSDGFSGISANPTLGHVADLIVALGGSALLAEFPELCGVEQELIDRCVDETTARRFEELMRSYEQRVTDVGDGFENNPSPGNIRDGLITDAMKSAGAAKKGGTSPIVDVLDYAEQRRKQGLTLLCTPGSDVESTTCMAGSGANLMLFSTGLGTPTGNAITPTLKISSNTKVAQQMPDVIDYDTGSIISGERDIQHTGEELLELCIATASGIYTAKADALGQDDFIPWKRDISL